jgi:hypothetical protein
MLHTTIGQLLVNDALPPDMQDYTRLMDKKGIGKLLRELVDKHPDQYRDVAKRLSDVGRDVAYTSGSQSFGLEHLRPTPCVHLSRLRLNQVIRNTLSGPGSDQEKQDKIIEATAEEHQRLMKEIPQEAKERGNPLADQVQSGARGNPAQLKRLIGGDLLYVDHHENVIPFPVQTSFAEGLRPAEFWASTYGARKGLIDVKFCVSRYTSILYGDYTTRPIEEVLPGDVIMGADTTGRIFPTRVTRVFKNGVRDCYRYGFRKGSTRKQLPLELVATEDHKVLAKIIASDPSSSRNVRVPTLLPLRKAKLLAHPEYSAFLARGECNQPRKHVPEALLAGLMLGDGCMAPSTHGQYSLSCADPTLLTDVADYLAGFGLHLTRSCATQYTYNLSQLVKSSPVTAVIAGHNSFTPGMHNATKRWLKESLHEKLAHEKALPADVWDWDDASLGALLGGIFATDATIATAAGRVSITLVMTAQGMMRDLQRLLELRLGIWTTSLTCIPLRANMRHTQYKFSVCQPEAITRFSERVALVGCKRQQLSTALRTLPTLRQELTAKICYKEFVGAVETYDLEVENPAHMYVLANGLIVSNSTQDAGYFAKQLGQLSHRLMVTDIDAPEGAAPPGLRGLPVATADPDNEGALLAHPVGEYKRNTILTPKILKELDANGVKKILVRSPAVGGPSPGGVYVRDVGVREKGTLPPVGDMVGIAAAQALCLSIGTEVRMADGSAKAIELIRVGDVVLACDMAGTVRPARVLAVHANGVRECVRTVFRRGTGKSIAENLLVLDSTQDHKYLGYARTSHQAMCAPVLTTPASLSNNAQRHYACLPVSFDDTGNRVEPYALLLGIAIGDCCYTGGVSSNGIDLACADSSQIADMSQYMANLGLRFKQQYDPIHYRIVDDKRFTYTYVNGRRIRNRFRGVLLRYGLWGQYSGQKRLPQTYDWDNQSVAALIAGLLATDGWVHVGANGCVSAGFSSNSKAMMEELRVLLSVRFGIYTSGICKSIKKRVGGGTYAPNYKLIVSAWDSVNRLQQLPIPGRKRNILAAAMQGWPRPKTAASACKANFVRQEPLGQRATFDIEVDHPAHLFVLANGLLVSNSERLTQGQLGSKHSGGVKGEAKSVAGFEHVNQLVQVPETFKGGAAHAQVDGHVTDIHAAPAGGQYITISGQRHYVAPDFDLKVKKGDTVEAGDMLSDGIPNPKEIVKHKGIGEGRRYFIDAFCDAYRNSGMPFHRRNVELIARGLINHVELTDEDNGNVPGDIVPYQELESTWVPRHGTRTLSPKAAVGKYLESPVLHYTVGTPIKPSMVPTLNEFGVKEVEAHDDPPPFQPTMVRAMAAVGHDPDWMTRFLGSNQKRSLLDAVHRGATSDIKSTSFVPALAAGLPFGTQWPQNVLKPPGG